MLIFLNFKTCFFYIYSTQTITIKKSFFNRKRKSITYNADIWLEAEKFFPLVNEANMTGADVKYQVQGDMHLSSNIWGEYQKRYTGIHAFTPSGRIAPLTGVNLDEREWCMLVDNFPAIKDCLKGKKVDLSKTVMANQEVETVKVYIAEWMLNGDVMEEGPIPKECYT